MAHRSFAQAKDDTVRAKDPITFDFAGEKNFTCRRRTNGKLLMELIAQVDSDNTQQQVAGILSVFDVTVLTDDGEEPEKYTGKRREKHTDIEIELAEADEIEPGIDPTSSLGRLIDVFDDPNTEIEVEELAEMVGWLVEQYVGRPTESAPNLPRGVANMRRTSQRGRRTRASISGMPKQDGSLTSSSES